MPAFVGNVMVQQIFPFFFLLSCVCNWCAAETYTNRRLLVELERFKGLEWKAAATCLSSEPARKAQLRQPMSDLEKKGVSYLDYCRREKERKWMLCCVRSCTSYCEREGGQSAVAATTRAACKVSKFVTHRSGQRCIEGTQHRTNRLCLLFPFFRQ